MEAETNHVISYKKNLVCISSNTSVFFPYLCHVNVVFAKCKGICFQFHTWEMWVLPTLLHIHFHNIKRFALTQILKRLAFEDVHPIRQKIMESIVNINNHVPLQRITIIITTLRQCALIWFLACWNMSSHYSWAYHDFCGQRIILPYALNLSIARCRFFLLCIPSFETMLFGGILHRWLMLHLNLLCTYWYLHITWSKIGMWIRATFL